MVQFGLNQQARHEHGRREPMNAKANLHEQFGHFDHYWNPKLVASVNDRRCDRDADG